MAFAALRGPPHRPGLGSPEHVGAWRRFDPFEHFGNEMARPRLAAPGVDLRGARGKAAPGAGFVRACGPRHRPRLGSHQHFSHTRVIHFRPLRTTDGRPRLAIAAPAGGRLAIYLPKIACSRAVAEATQQDKPRSMWRPAGAHEPRPRCCFHSDATPTCLGMTHVKASHLPSEMARAPPTLPEVLARAKPRSM
jgi:hypothetical protein